MFDSKDVGLVTRITADVADVAEIEAALAAVGRLRGSLDAAEARLVRRADDLSRRGVGAGGAATLRDQQRVTRRSADRTQARAEALAAAPALEGALADGRVGGGHVDAVVRAAASLPEVRRSALYERADGLVELAGAVPADAFERRCRQLARRLDVDDGESRLARQKRQAFLRRWSDPVSGMWCLRADLDPESGAMVEAVLDAEIERLVQVDSSPRDERTAAAALMSLATRPGRGGVRPELLLVADVDTWRSGLGDDSISETSSGVGLPPSTLHRLACDADTTVVLHDDRGVAIAVGRRRRTATRVQRRALRSMYPRCAFDDCDQGFERCQIHHLVPWAAGGVTDLGNLVPLCSRHHQRVHEEGWRIDLAADRTLTIRRPDGALHHRVVLPSAAAAQRRAADRTEEIRLARQRVAARLAPAPP